MATNPFERFLVARRGELLGMTARNDFSILPAKFQKKRGPSRLQTDAARRQGRGGELISPRHRTRSNGEHGDRAAPARRECEDRECGRSPSGRSFAATFLPAAPVRALPGGAARASCESKPRPAKLDPAHAQTRIDTAS